MKIPFTLHNLFRASLVISFSALADVTLVQDETTAVFEEVQNYTLRTFGHAGTPSILEKMELIFHLHSRDGMFYVSESNSQSRFGPNQPELFFKRISNSQQHNAFTVEESNAELRVTRNFELDPEERTLDVSYLVQALKEIHFGPHCLTPAILLNVTDPLVLFPGQLVGTELRCEVLKNSADKSIRCQDWVVVYDPEKAAGLAITGPGHKFSVFRHSRIGSDQSPCWTIAMKASALQKLHLAAGDTASWSLKLHSFKGSPEEQAERLHEKFSRTHKKDQFSDAVMLSNNESLTAWFPGSNAQVMRYASVLDGTTQGVLEFSCATNEWATLPIMIRGKQNEKVSLELAAEDFVTDKGVRFAAENLGFFTSSWYEVKDALHASGVVGDVPDALSPISAVSVGPADNAVLWLRVKVPSEQEEGIYSGRIQLKSGKTTLAALPVALQVFNFSLPERRSLPVWTPVWEWEMNKVYGTQKAEELMPAYLKNLYEHRGGMWATYPQFRFKEESDELDSFAWQQLESDLDLFFNKLKMPFAVCRIFRIGGGHRLVGTPFGAIEEMFSELWEARYRKLAILMRDYEEKKGMKGRLIYELYDEPYDEDNANVLRCAEILHSAYPEMKVTFWSGRGFVPALEQEINCWTVSDTSLIPALARKLQRQGKDVWVYNPVEYTGLSMPMGAPRLLFWKLWQLQLDGLFFWNISSWKEWGGTYSRPNRDSTLVYPGDDGPINTVRWEAFRDGLQDYEYLSLLKNNVSLLPTAKRNKAESLLAEIAQGDFADFDTIPKLNQWRAEIGALLNAVGAQLTHRAPWKFEFEPVEEELSQKYNLTASDFPVLVQKGCRKLDSTTVERLESRLLKLKSPKSRQLHLTLVASGKGEIMPELFVRYMGNKVPDAPATPLQYESSEARTSTYTYSIPSIKSDVLEVKVILQFSKNANIAIDELILCSK